ncbi:MAG TPA: hypothetical protein VHB68_09345 [Steroidobacteraceae bacterium]|nr:hypothetical protein [Steroidobacteraceae bacterium]
MEIVFSDESGRSNVARVIDATVGNDVLQLRYLTPGPITGMKTNFD